MNAHKSKRDWSVYIKGVHIKDCTEEQLRNWLKNAELKSVATDNLAHSGYWPDGWAIWPLPEDGYAAIDNGGQPMTYADGEDVIAGDTFFAIVARVIIVSIKNKLTMGTGA